MIDEEGPQFPALPVPPAEARRLVFMGSPEVAVGTLRTLVDAGFEVFCDLKLHDIPNTVASAARVLGGLGARYVTMHTSGGAAMLRAGVDGLAEGAAAAGLPAPLTLGVTVLTSDPDAPDELLQGRAALAEASGCGGLVCAGTDLPTLRGVATGLIRVVPGIRPAGASVGDQARVTTPEQAVRDGAGILVVGRPITQAVDPAAAARAIRAEIAAFTSPDAGGDGGGAR